MEKQWGVTSAITDGGRVLQDIGTPNVIILSVARGIRNRSGIFDLLYADLENTGNIDCKKHDQQVAHSTGRTQQEGPTHCCSVMYVYTASYLENKPA